MAPVGRAFLTLRSLESPLRAPTVATSSWVADAHRPQSIYRPREGSEP